MPAGLRARVLYQFKELLYMGHEYPMPYDEFRARLKKAFRAKRDLQQPEDIEKALALGEYVKKEIIALHQLRVYRAVKRQYYN